MTSPNSFFTSKITEWQKYYLTTNKFTCCLQVVSTVCNQIVNWVFTNIVFNRLTFSRFTGSKICHGGDIMWWIAGQIHKAVFLRHFFGLYKVHYPQKQVFESHPYSSVTTPICQEGQSERTDSCLFFPSFPLFPNFPPLFPDFFLSFSQCLANFWLSREALCPLASPDQVPKSATFPKWAMLCRIRQYDFLKLFRIQQL